MSYIWKQRGWIWARGVFRDLGTNPVKSMKGAPKKHLLLSDVTGDRPETLSDVVFNVEGEIKDLTVTECSLELSKEAILASSIVKGQCIRYVLRTDGTSAIC